MENLEILQKLYSLQHSLIDLDEIEIIRKLISKRKININISKSHSFSIKDKAGMSYGINKIYYEAISYCWDVYGIDGYELENEVEEGNLLEERNKLFLDFTILRLTIYREKKTLISRTAKESLNIIMKEEFIKLIIKYQKK